MRVLIAAVLAAGVLAGCNARGGRLVVLLPEEVNQRNDTEWHVTGEPAGGARPAPRPDQATER
jgi:hypothetical protein